MNPRSWKEAMVVGTRWFLGGRGPLVVDSADAHGVVLRGIALDASFGTFHTFDALGDETALIQVDSGAQVIRPWVAPDKASWWLPEAKEIGKAQFYLRDAFYEYRGLCGIVDGQMFVTLRKRPGTKVETVPVSSLSDAYFVRRCPSCRKNQLWNGNDVCIACSGNQAGPRKASKGSAKLKRLILDALEAEERFDIDELEAHADAEREKAREKPLGYALAEHGMRSIGPRGRTVAKYLASEASGAPVELYSDPPLLERHEPQEATEKVIERLHALRCPKCGRGHEHIVVWTQGACMTRLVHHEGRIVGDEKDGHHPQYAEDAMAEARRILGLEDPDDQTAAAECGGCSHAWKLPSWAWKAIWG